MQNHRSWRAYELCTYFFLALVPSSIVAQSTASLHGHITDTTGAMIAQADLRLTQAGTGAVREGTSRADGSYEFTLLQPGTYTLTVSASGFTTAERQGLDLLVNISAMVDVQLKIGTTKQSVEVISSGPAQVNTADATLGAAFNQNQVAQLPIEARNVVELLSLQPGVTFLGDRINSFTDSRSGSVNGARSDQSNVTLDGVDVNDQKDGYAFTSVLRVTQDSVQEFRVTTSNANADSGRSSGAQVALVTKSGTNEFHGSVYEFHRNTIFSANDPLLKASQLESGQANERSPLLRNVFGAALGGPLKKNRLFFFVNYQADDGSVVRLTPDDLLNMDPQNKGISVPMMNLLQTYPLPNESLGDDLNFAGFRFAATEARKFDTYIAKIDWNITRDGRHTMFWRGNLQNDNSGSAPQFPGQPAASSLIDNSKGFALGYTFLVGPHAVNNFRWGYTRQGIGLAGIAAAPIVYLSGILDNPEPDTRSSFGIRPVHNLIDDLSWSAGNHTLQFGANVRLIGYSNSSLQNSFSSASMNVGWLGPGSGVANTGSAFDPAIYGFPAVSDGYSQTYDNALLAAVGIVTEGDAIYNYDRTGNPIPLGIPIKRDYAIREYEMYAQDSWKVKPSFTLNYGLRWTLLAPPYETHGTQVGPCTLSGTECTPLDLSDWFDRSAYEGATGGAAINAGHVSFAPSGPLNRRPSYWNWDYKDLAPRVAFAWAPNTGEGWLGKVFGRKGDLSVRGGYSLVYDHFGVSIVNTFDQAGSFGLTSQVSNPAGTVNVGTAPRFIGFHDIPPDLLPPPPPGGFPATPDPEAFAISWGLDSNLKTPYAHVLDFAVSRQLNKDTLLEVAYVGRLARRLPVQEDLAMPLNLVDPKSKMDYFGAATMLSKMAVNGVAPQDVAPIPYWENMFPALAGIDIGFGTNTSPTQVAYDRIVNNLHNETYALLELDLPDDISGAGLNVPGHSYQSYRYYHDQYSSLYAWRTLGESNYHALEISLRKSFTHGLQGDFNYTLSKSLDWTSAAERRGVGGFVNGAQIINTWKPNQLYGISDFDATHQINANWVWQLPFGKGQKFGSKAGGVLNAVISGWQFSGLFRWTSGFPFAVDEGGQWPTNWDIEGWAVQQDKIPSAAAARGKGPNRFKDPAAVLAAFRSAYPGESGSRNPLRGDGYFGIDIGLSKYFPITEKLKAQFRWETFNITNSVRYDAQSIRNLLDEPDSFGTYRGTLTNPRVMQFALRLEF